MTPHPPHHARVPRRTARRSIALFAALLVIGGTPLVARALDEEVPPAVAGDLEPSTVSMPERGVAERPEEPIADLGANLEADADAEADAATEADADAATDAAVDVDAAAAAAEPAEPAEVGESIDAPAAVVPGAVAERTLDPVVAVLTNTYAWDERGPRIVVLQDALGIDADGWYGHATHEAHRAMLAAFGLSADTLPVPPPPGPTAEQWAALRECESSGNYSITNPSGKYRGAYQFDRPTWNSVAERHAPHLVGVDPAAASPADQDAMARALYGDRGASPWPLCGRHLS
jgi:hypothetical protein